MTIDTGATAWVLVATAMVLLMTPAVGLFYAGLVQRKNFINMVTLSLVALAVVAVQWVAVGYKLAFGGATGMAPAIPDALFMIFQMTFAAVAVAIITSAFAERARFGAYLVFAALWTTIVYDPLAYWVWGGGWLAQIGAIDFAGGTVVHISAGFGALAVAIVIGRRVGHKVHVKEPANIPWSLLGAALLWFGWIGFNGGSALAADGVAVAAVVTTLAAAAAGSLAWLIASWARGGHAGSLGFMTGAVAGLVAITPAAGYVTPEYALVIGAVGGLIGYYIMLWRQTTDVDETLDAWAVHGMVGIWGAVATGIFAVASVNGKSGLLEGNFAQFGAQVMAAGAAAVFAFVVTYIIAVAIDKTIGLRVSESEEYVGLDISQHGERF